MNFCKCFSIYTQANFAFHASVQVYGGLGKFLLPTSLLACLDFCLYQVVSLHLCQTSWDFCYVAI